MAQKMHQCQICRSIQTDGTVTIGKDVIAACGDCTREGSGTVFAHEGQYIVATNPSWGSSTQRYMRPIRSVERR